MDIWVSRKFKSDLLLTFTWRTFGAHLARMAHKSPSPESREGCALTEDILLTQLGYLKVPKQVRGLTAVVLEGRSSIPSLPLDSRPFRPNLPAHPGSSRQIANHPSPIKLRSKAHTPLIRNLPRSNPNPNSSKNPIDNVALVVLLVFLRDFCCSL